MAGKLEDEIKKRVNERLGKELSVPPDIQDCHNVAAGSSGLTKLYGDFFSNLRLALLNGDLDKKTQLLKLAWNIAKESICRCI